MKKQKITRDKFGRHYLSIKTKRGAIYLPVQNEAMRIDLNKIKNHKAKIKNLKN